MLRFGQGLVGLLLVVVFGGSWHVKSVSGFVVVVTVTTTSRTSLVSSSSPCRKSSTISSSSTTPTPTRLFAASKTKKKVVVVIGGGWAGFSAADSLSKLVNSSSNNNKNENEAQQLLQVLLLDAAPRGQTGGLAAGGWTSPRLGLPVEAGIHGFWREYKNTFATMKESIGLSNTLDEVLTPYTPSMLVSEQDESGRAAAYKYAPVLGNNDTNNNAEAEVSVKTSVSAMTMDFTSSEAMLISLAEMLPPPLDLALSLSASDLDDGKGGGSNVLTASDLLSALGLLGPWADFGQEDVASWERYDAITAEALFRDIAGVSPRLYRHLVSPLLHVLPMAPGYDISAAAALSCFHVFALQSRGAFDVRWCRGTITEKIFDPWSAKLRERNVTILGSSRVTSILEQVEEENNSSSRKFAVTIRNSNNNTDDVVVCDAVVLAVGATAAKKLLQSSPPLMAAFPLACTNSNNNKNWNSSSLFQRGITCVAVRLFLKPDTVLVREIIAAMSDAPVVVCGPRIGGGSIPELAETGFCIYDLSRLQDDFAHLLAKGECLAIEVDFFRADKIDSNFKTDAEVADFALRVLSAALNISSSFSNKQEHEERNNNLRDVSVVRARNAVSHFGVGSSTASSPSTRLGHGMYICGDWVDRMGGHASWSTEKAVVTGKQAALALAQDFHLLLEQASTSSSPIKVIPAAPDTPQLAALRQVASTVRNVLNNVPSTGSNMNERILPPAPWVLLRQLMSGGK